MDRCRFPAAAICAVVIALALASCGSEQSDDCSGTPSDRARTLVFEVREEGTSPAQVEAAAGILCERLQALELDQAVVRPEGKRAIEVLVPPGTPKSVAGDLDRAARLRVYDWEANLIAPPGTDPAAPIPTLDEARELASGREGAIVIRAEPPEPGFFVVRNRSELSNNDLSGAALGADPATGRPTIELEFTERGSLRYQRLTRRIADRSGEQESPAHFAVVVDAELVALPTVDPNTAGGPPPPGVALVGKIKPVRAETLVELLEIGHQPIDLRLVEGAGGP